MSTLKDLASPDAAWQKQPGRSDLKGAILNAVVQTVEQFQKEAGIIEKGKEKGSGILSFLKRK